MNSKYSRLYGILSPNHKRLSPELWDSDTHTLLPAVKDKIIKSLMTDLDTHGVHNPETLVSGMYLIGSSATLRWSRDSDLDITVVINPLS